MKRSRGRQGYQSAICQATWQGVLGFEASALALPVTAFTGTIALAAGSAADAGHEPAAATDRLAVA